MILGVTGNFGSGKSEIAKMFMSHGAYIIDADVLGHIVLEEDKDKIVRAFGTKILGKDGEVDRKKLGDLVFNDHEKLARLNRLTHPKIVKKIKKIIKHLRKGFIVVDAALILEFGGRGLVDRLLVVTCKREIRVKRLKRMGYTLEEIKKRLKSQMKEEDKVLKAHFVIDNSGSLEETRAKVKKLAKDLRLI